VLYLVYFFNRAGAASVALRGLASTDTYTFHMDLCRMLASVIGAQSSQALTASTMLSRLNTLLVTKMIDHPGTALVVQR
jgi:hypothetical protein